MSNSIITLLAIGIASALIAPTPMLNRPAMRMSSAKT